MDVFIRKGITTKAPSTPLAWLIWCLFGNDRDGYIGDTGWNPQQLDTPWIRIKWWFRNPLHNLVFFVLGCEDVDSVRYGFPYAHGVFRPDGGWNFAFSKTSRMIYPFVSYIGPVKFYIGWRESGNFGIKLTKNSNWTPKVWVPKDDRIV